MAKNKKNRNRDQQPTDNAKSVQKNSTTSNDNKSNEQTNKKVVEKVNRDMSKEDDSTTVPTSTNYYPKSPETGDYITYLFRPVRGFSKFSYFTGNGILEDYLGD